MNVTDNIGNTSEDTTWAWIQDSNNPPNKPSIDGKKIGNINTYYDYTFVSTDPEGVPVWYYIEWGDGQTTGWIGPYPSGKVITQSYEWSWVGRYTIRCKAKDPYGAESEWGELKVTMPKNQQSSNMWYLRWLERFPNAFPILRYLLGLT